MRLHKYFLVTFLTLAILQVVGQNSPTSDSICPSKSDSCAIISPAPLKATTMIFGINMGVWAFDRFALNADWARINFNTIRKNFKTGFVWDNDMFSTNLFFHPYHGGLYFNATRSNGLNFWQSVPFTACGSLMWELFLENEPPAINDFIATTVGGACLGEISHRISDRLIDERTVGFERFKREALITLVSPIRGINRILNGDSWRHRNIRGNAMPLTTMTFYTSLGYRLILNSNEDDSYNIHMFCYNLGLNYGDPFEPENSKPYDFFSLRMSGNFFSQQPLISHFSGLGQLFSKHISLQKPNQQLNLSLFQHFNFYQANAETDNILMNPFKISEAASVGPGMMYKRSSKNFIFSGALHLSGILLGGSQTDHFKFAKRDYNMGSGFSSKMNLSLDYRKKIMLTLISEDYRLYSWVGNNPVETGTIDSDGQGDIGNSSLSVVNLSLNYYFANNFFISAESGYYYRRTIYKYYDDVRHGISAHRLSIGYIF